MQTNLFELNPDLTRLIENVQLGPQAEVLELIESFNDKYIQGDNHVNRPYYLQAPTKPLGITKKFYWRPGAYDTIKKILWHQGEMHKKACSLEKVIQRVKDSSSYRLRNIQNEIYEIECILNNFRQQGLIMQDNTDDVIEAWNLLYNHLMDQYEKSDHKFAYSLNEVINGNNDLCNYNLDIVYNYQDVNMEFKHAGSTDSIAEIIIPGHGFIGIRFSLNKLLNSVIMANHDLTKLKNITSGRYSNNSRHTYLIGGNWISYDGIYHPYISAAHSDWNNRNHTSSFKYVCVGNLEDEFHGCIASLDFLSLQIFVDRVMKHYDTNTGPLNRINYSYHGQPEYLEDNEEYYDIIPKTHPSDCRYRSYLLDLHDDGYDVQEDSYCANYCAVKNNCSTWNEITKVLTPEEIQQKTLENATLQMVRRNRS